MKNRIEYKGFYIDKTENGYRICRQEDTEKHTHLSNLNPSYRLIDNVLSYSLWMLLFRITCQIKL